MFLGRFLGCALCLCVAVYGNDHSPLKIDQIQEIMQQIFSQHVSKKEISTEIIEDSFMVYIDQFDPDRIYLLQEEVNPFLKMSHGELTEAVHEYKKDDFSDYHNLDQLFQKSILRSRAIREKLEQNRTALFAKKPANASDQDPDWNDPDLKRDFSKTEEELAQRVEEAVLEFISAERRRYGKEYVDSREAQTLKLLEKEVRSKEDQYLYVKGDGSPMSAQEKENLFSLHVLKSLANSLDAHTTVMDPKEAYEMRVRLEQEIQGIGVLIVQGKKGDLIIAEVLPGGPAAKSGLVQTDDRLIEVNGESVVHESSEKAMQLIRGKKGTKVALTLLRNNDGGEKQISVELVREDIPINADRVQVALEKFGTGVIGRIKLDSFYQSDAGYTSETDVRDAIKELDKQGNLRGLILDLRENSGGFLSQAVKVAGLFITNGVIVISKYFNGDEHFYRDMDGKKAYSGPLIILTSKATASAAEIVAQALQDYGVALIVGDEQTYGKGTIQSQTVTGDEGDGSTYFKVTVGQYYTVSGKTPQLHGVKADVVVPSMFFHETLGEEHLDFPLAANSIPSAFNDKLTDVSPDLKSWYMHYYIPTLQNQKIISKDLIETLQKNSAQRIAQNKRYQDFIKGKPVPFDDPRKPSDISSLPGDLQADEAMNVLKDFIVLEGKEHGN